MEITKEYLQNELTGLHAQLRNAEANVDAIRGAIQVMEHLIGVTEKEEKEVEE